MTPLLPSREQIALLDAFQGLELRDIDLVATPRQAEQALAALARLDMVGLDTESKPTFARNEISQGPHTVQFASLDHAWVFQLHDADCRAAAARLLASDALTKVGFGLANDRVQIRDKLGIEPRAVIDLDALFRQRGHRKSLGVRTAVALLFGQRFAKSRKQTTSNWASRHLTEGQLRYAANDAYAALRVMEELRRERGFDVTGTTNYCSA